MLKSPEPVVIIPVDFAGFAIFLEGWPQRLVHSEDLPP
jgi:hypothetical protein